MVSIDGMADAIMKDLTEYASVATDDMKQAVRDAGNTVKKQIQANAPVDTGAYKKSWTVTKVSENSSSLGPCGPLQKPVPACASSGAWARETRRRPCGGKTAHRSCGGGWQRAASLRS
jgi:hypothetical protein